MAATRVLKILTDSVVIVLQDLLSSSILFSKHLKGCFNKMELLTIVQYCNVKILNTVLTTFFTHVLTKQVIFHLLSVLELLSLGSAC